MLEISVREFQLHASEYLDKLPIVLTVYGKPLAKILRYDETVSAPPVDPPKKNAGQAIAEIVAAEITDEDIKKGIRVLEKNNIPGVMSGADLLAGKKVKVPDPVEIYPCEYMHCKNPSVGKFQITQYDGVEGVEIKAVLRLCQFHLEMAQGKGDVKEV